MENYNSNIFDRTAEGTSALRLFGKGKLIAGCQFLPCQKSKIPVKVFLTELSKTKKGCLKTFFFDFPSKIA